MKPVLLIDFGSTYTKVTAVDVEGNVLLGTAASYTTVQTDINDGLHNAMVLLEEKIGQIDFVERYACSSAAGGLRMVTSGLVPSLTAEAAKRASLGAGAKVIKVFSYEMIEDDIDEIDALKPDIMLLTGGTDGGNTECILHNAKMLAASKANFPIVLAGNRNAARQCKDILEKSGKKVYVCENVMPKFDELNIDSVQKQIREIFLERIIQAKGLSKATELVSGILMPTPAAVLEGVKLLSEGTKEEKGWGELLVVDLGGATTDVYSITHGYSTKPGTVLRGLPEPYAKRTVEGDIGMRYSAHGIVEAAGIERVCEISGLSEEKALAYLALITTKTETLPTTEELVRFDFALAALAVETAVTRHAGYLEQVYTLNGLAFVQTGKDLSELEKVVATGGAIIHTEHTGNIVSHTFASERDPLSLKPVKADVYVDRQYILASMGLLADKYPLAALKIMKKELLYDGIEK